MSALGRGRLRHEPHACPKRESCYVWEPPKGSGILHTPQPDHPANIMNWSIADPIGQSATMVKLTRAISNTASSTSVQAA